MAETVKEFPVNKTDKKTLNSMTFKEKAFQNEFNK